MPVSEPIPLADLGAQVRTIRDEIQRAIDAVLDRADFILGDATVRFEAEFAAMLGSRHAIGVGSGLDALRLALQAAGIGVGDEVILPVNTFVATALAVSTTGARPVLVDCREDTYQLDAARIPSAITPRTRAVIPVHLYGQPADMDAIRALAQRHGLIVIEDAAQAHGARFAGRACGTIGRLGCFSFYPAKNLGAFGDGGLVTTDDDELAERVRVLRNYGQRTKGEHVARGANSRLDTLQAAVLSVKLGHLERWNMLRARHAARYTERLAGAGVVTPILEPRGTHVFHLYVVRSPRRDALRAHLAACRIETGIHYPTPLHLQPAFRDLGYPPGSFPVAERLSGEILSLPMFPELTDQQIDRVTSAIASFAGAA